MSLPLVPLCPLVFQDGAFSVAKGSSVEFALMLLPQELSLSIRGTRQRAEMPVVPKQVKCREQHRQREQHQLSRTYEPQQPWWRSCVGCNDACGVWYQSGCCSNCCGTGKDVDIFSSDSSKRTSSKRSSSNTNCDSRSWWSVSLPLRVPETYELILVVLGDDLSFLLS